MIAYMKQYLNEVEPDVKVRFQIACVGMAGAVVALVTTAITVLRH